MAKIGSLFVFIILAQIAQGQLTINEASNANQSTLVLPDGSRPDWIELFTNEAINLEGYSLPTIVMRCPNGHLLEAPCYLENF